MCAKKKFFWLPLLALVFFSGCGEDDDSGPSREELLVGTWTSQSSELTDYSFTLSALPVTITKDNVQDYPELAADAEEIEENLELLARQLFPPNGTVTFDEDNTYILTNDQGVTQPDTWRLSSNEQQLTIDVESNEIETFVFDIVELTDTSLRVFLTLDDSDFDLGEEEIESFTIEYTFSFTK